MTLVEALNKELAERSAQVEQHKSEFEEAKTQAENDVRDLEEILEMRESKIEDLESDKQRLEARIEDYKEFHVSNADLEAKIDDFKSQMARLEETIEVRDKTIAELSSVPAQQTLKEVSGEGIDKVSALQEMLEEKEAMIADLRR